MSDHNAAPVVSVVTVYVAAKFLLYVIAVNTLCYLKFEPCC